MSGLRSLVDVNNKLLEQLYDTICNTSEPQELLALTESVAKLNASLRNNNQFDNEDDSGGYDTSQAFSGCAEAIVE